MMSSGISRACVPLFFLMSGYLFFSNKGIENDKFSWKIYAQKLSRRRYSLLYPYIIYNSITLVLFAIVQAIFPQLISEGRLAIADYMWSDYLMDFWTGQEGNFPIDFPLWFIRNLMVICIFSPLVYMGLKYFHWIGIAILAIIYLSGYQTYSIPGIQCVFFFSVGAYCAIENIDFGKCCCKIRRMLWILYPILLIVDFYFSRNIGYNTVLHKFVIVIGVMTFISIGYYIQESKGWNFPSKWTAATFFVYAFHGPFFSKINTVLARIIPLADNTLIWQALEVFLYFTVTIAYIAFLIALYNLIQHMSPSLANLLSGGRISRK